MRQDSDRFIIIEHLNTNTFREFACELLGDDERIAKIMNSYKFTKMRVRNNAISRDDDDELEFILKQVYDKRQSECYLCYNDMKNSKWIRCYHCRNEICLTCAHQFFDTTSYRCPFCGHQYIYHQLSKPGDIERDMTDLESHFQHMMQ